MIKRKLEICCYTAESAFRAAQAGAHRIELCDNVAEGGTTPSWGTIKQVAEQLQIPVNVIVRPRGGDFLYSDADYHILKEDVAQIKTLGANGIVIGFLTPEGEIDLQRTAEIIDMAAPMEVTFHRAFDMCRDLFAALEQLKELGVTRILTSGGYASAEEGIDVISKLVKKANEDIIIMPGSGINDKNLSNLMQLIKADEYHSSAKIFIEGGMQFKNKNVSMSGNGVSDEFRHISVDVSQIEKMLDILDDHK